VQALVEALLETSEQEPVIILQGDTGPPYGYTTVGQDEDLTDGMLQQNMRILNAYYLPPDGETGLYPSISPVNSFRVIFNYYFNAGIPLLEDQSYYLPVEYTTRRFIDVTARVDYR
jgi:hypothetical protein